MKIVNYKEKNLVKIEKLKFGEVFKHDDRIFMKIFIDEEDEFSIRVFDFTRNYMDGLTPDTLVEKLEAELHIL